MNSTTITHLTPLFHYQPYIHYYPHAYYYHCSGRIVTLTSSLHHATTGFNFNDIMTERGYEMFSNYAQSKLANLLFTRELTRRYLFENIYTV